MEQENKSKTISVSGLIIAILLTIIITTAINFGVYYFVLKPKESTPEPIVQNTTKLPQSTNITTGNTINPNRSTFENKETDLENITYDIIVSDWANKSGNMVGGFSTIYGATLVNSNKKEMYEIGYSDVWDIHEQNGSKDSVSVDVHKISDNKLANIQRKQYTQPMSTVKVFLDNHVKVDYDLEISYQCLDDIQYDILVKDVETTIKEDVGRKTPDGIYADEHYYELVNSQQKKKIRVYCYDLAKEYNEADEDDNVIVEIEQITDEELSQVISSNTKTDTLQDLSTLLNGIITEEYYISVKEY